MRRLVTVILALGLGLGVGTLGGQLVSPRDTAATAGAPVIVTNTPLPVTGTVSVGNLPATQAVSGTVNVGNTPTVVPAANTVVVAKGRVTLPPAGYNSPPTITVLDADVTAYKEVRLVMFCILPLNPTPYCAPADFLAGVPDPELRTGGQFSFDHFKFDFPANALTRTYELPGTNDFQILGINPVDTADMVVDFVLYGRSN